MGPSLVDALALPSGAPVRGRGLRDPLPAGPTPSWGLYLGTRRLRRRHDDGLTWPHAWLRWPDFGVPSDRDEARAAVRDLHRRVHDGEAAEVACGGGVGRTGTVLACLAVLDGLDPAAALRWVREHHDRRAVETPWQRRWIERFAEHGSAAR